MIRSSSLGVPYQTAFTNGAFDAVADVPVENGGGGQGFGPHELLEAALATCLTMTARMSAAELAHARAHAATLPEYVGRGERPSFWQIVTFGAAGGLVPCPAAVTVMLLAISVNRTGNGLVMVAGFSLGLAATLVGIGLAVVMGLNALGSRGRFGWLSRRAPVVSAAVVVLSGVAAVVIALVGTHPH